MIVTWLENLGDLQLCWEARSQQHRYVGKHGTTAWLAQWWMCVVWPKQHQQAHSCTTPPPFHNQGAGCLAQNHSGLTEARAHIWPQMQRGHLAPHLTCCLTNIVELNTKGKDFTVFYCQLAHCFNPFKPPWNCLFWGAAACMWNFKDTWPCADFESEISQTGQSSST